MDFAPVNDPKALESTNDVFATQQPAQQYVTPAKHSGGPLNTPMSTAMATPQRPQTTAEDEANLQEMKVSFRPDFFLVRRLTLKLRKKMPTRSFASNISK